MLTNFCTKVAQIFDDFLISDQSYKGSTIVNYNARVVIWGILKSGMTLEA